MSKKENYKEDNEQSRNARSGGSCTDKSSSSWMMIFLIIMLKLVELFHKNKNTNQLYLFVKSPSKRQLVMLLG